MYRTPLLFSVNESSKPPNKKKQKKLKLKKHALDPVNYEEEKKNDPKYKTELCKSFMNNNFCIYGNQCRFAHGMKELVIKTQNSNYKKKLCKSFFENGFCTYGIRCNFQHYQKKMEDIQLPFYYINLIIGHNLILLNSKRLKIFSDFSLPFLPENLSSASTFSNVSSLNNSPNKNLGLDFCFNNNYEKLNIIENNEIKNDEVNDNSDDNAFDVYEDNNEKLDEEKENDEDFDFDHIFEFCFKEKIKTIERKNLCKFYDKDMLDKNENNEKK